MRVLIVEDNRDLAQWLARALGQAQYDVELAFDGEAALETIGLTRCDAVILDLSLPRADGMTVLRRLRAAGQKIPVIVLTANASLEGRVSGLDAGADDYMAKPFDLPELEARLRAVIRRGHALAAPEISVGQLSLNTATRQFSLAGEAISLTPREFAVLEYLIFKAGHTVTKTALSDSIFGTGADTDPSAIEIYVHRLRKKIEGSNVEIATLRGLGYLLRAV